NAELDGDTGAAFAIRVTEGIAISEINVRPVMMNVLMTHLHVAEHCPRRQVKVTISLSLPVTVRYSAIVFLRGVASPIADQPGTESDWAITELTVTCCTLLIATFSILRF